MSSQMPDITDDVKTVKINNQKHFSPPTAIHTNGIFSEPMDQHADQHFVLMTSLMH